MIVVNTTFRMCPWADVVYGMDSAWWTAHIAEVTETFKGARVAPIAAAGARRVKFRRCRNSGAGAIAFAAFSGARRIGLIGYDCKEGPDGQKHWHGDHPEGAGAGNAGSIKKWPGQFRDLAHALGHGVEIVNVSRDTALNVFPRGELEQFLDS